MMLCLNIMEAAISEVIPPLIQHRGSIIACATKKPIAFTSYSLSKAESKYVHLDKGLTIISWVEKRMI